jgi:aminoglycoside phosphotransferase (APT) family kinase protein
MTVPSTSTSVEGIDAEPTTAWMVAHIEGVTPPLRFAPIAGGHSNLTYLVVDAAGRELVLRRPPLGNILSTAHDMGREHRLISALGSSDVPVPPALGLCEDPEVNGAPFYVMAFVPGAVLAFLDDGLAYPAASRPLAADNAVEVLARLHTVDPDAVGLGNLGRKEGYVERQLKRWHAQFEQSKTRELPLEAEVHRRLSEAVPPQRYTGIVHGDYRLGNMLVGPEGDVRAVLDWELATLGDTLADLGWLVSHWEEPGEEYIGLAPPSTMAPGFPTRAHVVEHYGAATGRDLSDLPYYLAFARWRNVCILEGVLSRYKAGVMGRTDVDMDVMARSVELHAEEAKAALDSWK